MRKPGRFLFLAASGGAGYTVGMRISLPALACLGLVAFPAVAEKKSVPRVHFTEHKLDNGLRVLLVEDHAVPVISISVTYNAGSRDEKPGHTGFAHLFEHMMFQGSENVGKGEHFVLVEKNGGSMNGTTNADRTNYYQSLPANQLELALFLEADRMRSLAVTPANFENQRKTVKEERQQNYDNRAYGRTMEALHELQYDGFAYKHSTIGSMADLDAATVADAQAFFRTYYAPGNAVLVLVGDFLPAEALKRIEHHFGKIPAQQAPPVPDMAEPEQEKERRSTLLDPLARLTRVDIAYKIPPGPHADSLPLQALANILGGGRSARLHHTAVEEKQIAQSVGAYASERRGTGTLQISALMRPGHTTAEFEQLVYAEIERLSQPKSVEDWELDKVRAQARRRAAEQQRGSLSRAVALGEYAVAFNDPDLINRRADLVAKITKEDLQRVAKKYLAPTQRTVLVTQPPAAIPPKGKPQ
jgi:zinc protease